MLARRSVRIKSDDIVDATIANADLANKAVSRPKMSFISQIGSSKPGTITYGTPYKGGEPVPALTPTEAGAIEPSISPGSFGTAGFVFAGGVGTYYLYSAAGSA